MTEVAELVAGRELDALIAEKVMGMTNVELRLHVQGEDLFGERDGFTEWVPAYSTDIAAAWQIVEKILDQLSGFECGVAYFPFRWRAEFARAQYCGEAATAPLAICRAALAAVSH